MRQNKELAQIESMISQYTQSIQPPDLKQSQAVNFSDFMKAQPAEGLKYQVLPPVPSVNKMEVENSC
ncbi:MAG: hypothetical protein MZU97_09195 [Bacillus subtilis]|nr:hypothetical protein [Bacillus subtilis]